MKLTAYYDESGTHAGSPVSVMAGFLGDARQWISFNRRVTRLFNRYGVNIYHTIDVRRSDKDFSGWKVDRKLEFLDDFQHIINETLQCGVAAVIKYEDYEYYKSLAWTPKTRRDTLYCVLFRACVGHAMDMVLRAENWALDSEPQLKIVLEKGHANAPDVKRFYDQVQRRFGPQKALSGLTFGYKSKDLPLAAADLFAYTAWGEEVGSKAFGELRKPSKAEASYRGNFYRVPLDRPTLDALYEQAISPS